MQEVNVALAAPILIMFVLLLVAERVMTAFIEVVGFVWEMLSQ
jgi:hypothetical protein